MPNLLQSQVVIPVYHDSLFSTYYHQRNSLFDVLPQSKDDIIFLGNSITDGNEWSEMFNNEHIKNRGISGDFTAGVLHRIQQITRGKPAKIFLLIGINDLSKGLHPDSILSNIFLIADYVKQESPATRLYIQSLLPVNDVFHKFSGHTSKVKSIIKVNEGLKYYALSHQYIFIDLFPAFCNSDGKLSEQFTNDGLHLTGEGYLQWKHILFPYLEGVEEYPSIIPLPSKIVFGVGYFPIYKCSKIIIHDTLLNHEAIILKNYIARKGHIVEISNQNNTANYCIEFKIDTTLSYRESEEAYSIKVELNKITIDGKSTNAIFNGIQTLQQLMRDGIGINVCTISDQPAFKWRGFMIDVGRNYVSVKKLKQIIPLMAQYKLNVLHFHATEDIAWRIAIKQYPGLTAPDNMLRNTGMYYTEEDIKSIISSCKEYHILFIPEIDMPGHSAAFQRAFKVDMQSDAGLVIMKNILKEFCETYDVPYIHIGGDEVKITNQQFIPEITSYIEGLGKKVIGWQPGGNFTNNTIRQLWMEGNQRALDSLQIHYLDSRHLYLNHMDPLESVTTIFNRKICNRLKGDSNALGAILCVWHDRAVRDEEDIFIMNPVYSGMLAFSERVWRGGGQNGWVANISDGDIEGFRDFEQRLLAHKRLYFNGLPFPYFGQSDLVWNLQGPYVNDGNLDKIFAPELDKQPSENDQLAHVAIGGTVILRHWWAPLIKGAITNPTPNTTWYAHSIFYSDREKDQSFWIGFNNISRSPATDSPPIQAWDTKGSIVWFNGEIVNPPKWKRGGQLGNASIPLIDEGYEYRIPTVLHLKKGFNKVLIKLPVGSFKGKDWHNPVKWMFTFIPCESE